MEDLPIGHAMIRCKEKENGIYLMSIIGEIEGHELVSSNTKATKYEEILPQLAQVEQDKDVKGILILVNTVGGDIECGLAIAEMIASLSKPSVSLVLGGGHSIGVPIAVSADYSFIVPTATMIIHPVRLGGTLLGAKQTYEYFQSIQDRIIGFVSGHSHIAKDRMEELMTNTQMMAKDLGTMLVGEECIEEGIIDEMGGLSEAILYLKNLTEKS